MKLPMRFRILHLLADKKEMTSREVMEALKGEYSGEGQMKLPVVKNHLQSMRAVGLLEVTDVALDANGDLIEKFKITDYGESRLKYLPKEWQKY